ncbi:MAG: DNA adenine methylase [Ectothiorhodospiraceae bacterium AqS1]|nr:DNA adenine methylase [Ectothiorhodospiraceae bacterium AqS1]
MHASSNHSPFRYPGGKFYARKLILEQLPPSEVYCEPFAGGASIFFAKQRSKINILNDLDADVINTFKQIRDSVEELVALLDGLPATKDLHHYYKNEYQPQNDLERALRWFYLNRTSYSGIMKPENCYWGYHDKYSMRPENWPRLLRSVSKQLQDVELSSSDFEAVIESVPDDAFLFIDPPYYNADQKKFYPCSFDRSDHTRLSRCLADHRDRIRFLITYDNSAEVRDLYAWCDIFEEREWQYTISRTDDQKNGRKLADGYRAERQNGKELFIRNYMIDNSSWISPEQMKFRYCGMNERIFESDRRLGHR